MAGRVLRPERFQRHRRRGVGGLDPHQGAPLGSRRKRGAFDNAIGTYLRLYRKGLPVRYAADEKFEIGNDGEDEDGLIERFKKYEKFEAKLVA